MMEVRANSNLSSNPTHFWSGSNFKFQLPRTKLQNQNILTGFQILKTRIKINVLWSALRARSDDWVQLKSVTSLRRESRKCVEHPEVGCVRCTAGWAT